MPRLKSARVKPATSFLLTDEKAWWLMEKWEAVPFPGHGPHLIQQVQVVRGDELAVYRQDLGQRHELPTSQQGTQGFNFWAGFQYSVGEVRDIAQRLRENKPPEQREPMDLLGSYLKELDEKRQLSAHRSVVGPFLRVERR